MIQLRIQKVEISDANRLREIAVETFSETFSNENSEENMIQYLTENFSIDKLSKELKNCNSEFYFALYDTKPIGYLKLNFGNSQTELMNDDAIEIERIYVLKDFHGKCVGQTLLSHAITIARKRNSNFIWLGVWEKNKRAINFYEKNGFIEFDSHKFNLGEDEQVDLMMKLSVSEISYQDEICFIKKYIRNTDNLSILDFGTGEMCFINNIQESLKDRIGEIIAIDNKEPEDLYFNLGKINLIIQDGFEYIETTQKRFNLIIFSNVLHFYDYEKQNEAIRKALDKLKENGIIFIKIANLNHSYNSQEDKFVFKEDRIKQVGKLAEILEIRELEKHYDLILKKPVLR